MKVMPYDIGLECFIKQGVTIVSFPEMIQSLEGSMHGKISKNGIFCPTRCALILRNEGMLLCRSLKMLPVSQVSVPGALLLQVGVWPDVATHRFRFE
jgi:hypothetical protein